MRANMIMQYQAQYFAYKLVKYFSTSSREKLTAAMLIRPHQILRMERQWR